MRKYVQPSQSWNFLQRDLVANLMVTALASLLLVNSVQRDKATSLALLSSDLRTIDPRNEDFSDFEPIKKAIGSSRVVLLGEQSHGDGATIAAKIRLVKFLHQKMGFDVLAWESGVYSCSLADRNAKDPTKPASTYSEGIFGIWTTGGLFPILADYVKSTQSTASPIQTCGFDCQFSSKNSGSMFIAELRKALTEKGCGAEVSNIEEFLITKKGSISQEEQSRLGKDTLKVSKALMVRDQGDTNAILRQAVLALPALAKSNDLAALYSTLFSDPKTKKLIPAELGNVRDKSMADLLDWTVNTRYKGHKVIVWAASSHISRNIGKNRPYMELNRQEGNLLMMGDTVFSRMKNQAYSIAFVAYEGKAGNPFMPKPMEIPQPAKDSIEWMFFQSEKKFKFLDFRSLPKSLWLHDPLQMSPMGYAPVTTKWPSHFDGVFYTRTMFPHTKDFLLPEDAIK